jgi:hypothetical protein
MTRTYSVSASNVTVAGATTLVALRPSTTQAVEIIEVRVGFSANATSAQQRIQLVTQAVGTVALTSTAPVAYDKGSTATGSIAGGTGGAAGTSGTNASTEGGARVILAADTFNVLNGWLWVPGPDGKIILPAAYADLFAVWLPAAPGTLTGWSATVVFHEL